MRVRWMGLMAAFLCAWILLGLSPYAAPEAVATWATANDEPQLIVHGAGVLWGYDPDGVYRAFAGSNSLEGLQQCADAGQMLVELDFSFTADGTLAAIHDWSAEYIAGCETGVPMTTADFLASKIYWNFTPMTIHAVGDFLREHADMRIVTDLKDRFPEAVAAIAAACPDLLDRFIIQIYAEAQYDDVRELGFEHILFTLYNLTWEEKTNTEALTWFARRHPLLGYVFGAELCAEPGYLDGMRVTGVPLYIHTVNGADARAYYDAMGIAGIYTDDVVRAVE